MTERPDRAAVPNLTDYAAVRSLASLVAPERFNAMIDIVESRALRTPDALALLSLDANGEATARHSFAELAAGSRQMANALAEFGIVKGDRVFLMLPRIPEWYIAALGAIRLGAVPMPATSQLMSKDIQYRINKARACVAITDVEGAVRLDAGTSMPSLRHRIVVGEPPSSSWLAFDGIVGASSDASTVVDPTAGDDPMLLYFTSGTVAYPKMVMHTQVSCGLGHSLTARYWQDLRDGDVHWAITDTGWAKAAWSTLFGQWSQGAAVVQMNMGKPKADVILRAIATHGVTTFCAPPTLYRMLVLTDLAKYDLSGLRHCMAAGEPLNPEVIRIWENATGLPIYDGYGQTETVNVVANFRCLPIRPGSMGKPTPGFDVDVVDDAGHRCDPGVEGHIAVRVEPQKPLGVFTGYLDDPDATAAAFHEGWYFTGDKAHKDDDGYFWFDGRADDVITSSAYRIGPFEVESALVEHPAVAEAAVVGKDDPERTQIVTAFVILAPGYQPSPELAEELKEHVKGVTAPYKYPREIHLVEELPKTASGKIRRGELRERLRSGI